MTMSKTIEEILAEIRGEPIAKLARMENRMICREETHQRIEASLFSGIVPKLPPQTAVELIAIEGLEVRQLVFLRDLGLENADAPVGSR